MGYRDTYFNKNDAYDNNNGWYTCQKCGRKFRKGDMDIVCASPFAHQYERSVP